MDIDPPTLDRRIEQRVEEMWADGFVEEVRGLAGSGLREARTAHRALGYQQVLALLDGEITEAEAKQLTVNRTRQVRPAPGRLVPQGPEGDLVGTRSRRPRARRTGRWTRSAS